MDTAGRNFPVEIQKSIDYESESYHQPPLGTFVIFPQENLKSPEDEDGAPTKELVGKKLEKEGKKVEKKSEKNPINYLPSIDVSSSIPLSPFFGSHLLQFFPSLYDMGESKKLPFQQPPFFPIKEGHN
ncbi:unnamed protein product [Allacma fusca]|uniref:Uncharacterized protein n=1 Tax=Allacma fusca TaxID=39272 RepID=A0A8J2J8I8_9HEXA|nr:unnamed protein product [Allacma fusca]